MFLLLANRIGIGTEGRAAFGRAVFALDVRRTRRWSHSHNTPRVPLMRTSKRPDALTGGAPISRIWCHTTMARRIRRARRSTDRRRAGGGVTEPTRSAETRVDAAAVHSTGRAVRPAGERRMGEPVPIGRRSVARPQPGRHASLSLQPTP